MDEKKNKIIRWTYLGIMVLFILVVSFGGGDKAHDTGTETEATAAVETEGAAHDKADVKAPVAVEENHSSDAQEAQTAAEAEAEIKADAHADTETSAAAELEMDAQAEADAKTTPPADEKQEYLTAVLDKIVAADATSAHGEPAAEKEDATAEADAEHAAATHAAPKKEDAAAHGAEDAATADPFAGKPSPDAALAILKQGNQRFFHGASTHPHLNLERLLQAGSENQGDHAYATVITCSDSRVPVEAIFDAGIMDIFVIRVAGNVCDVDERGSIEYGLAHVNTPVLVVLGHTQCGAVTAVTQAVLGHGHALERNIPPLVDNIIPAVKNAMAAHPDVEGTDIIPMAIEENIWTGIEELFMESPATRKLVSRGKVKVVGAVYDVGEGTIKWLPQEKATAILKKVEADPQKAME